MQGPLEHPVEEIKRLQRCISDLVSVLALPAIWTGSEPSRVISTLLDTLLGMLRLDFVYASLNDRLGEAPFEMARSAPSQYLPERPQQIRELVSQWLRSDPNQWPADARIRVGAGDLSIVALQMGLHAEIGVIVAGSQRSDFPNDTERLVLSVAANQAVIGLREARILSEQKRAAQELDRRVAQRTKELAQSNEELQLQVGLLQHLPVSAWTLKPDGTPDFVNRVWLEYSGQTLDFLRSHPEAWMTAVHPGDRETAARAFWDGVRSGQGFAIETRSLRARDGTYRWHLQQAVALRDADGKVLKFVGTTTDIDDQKRAQEELRASEANLRRVIDTIPTLSWCNLPDGPNEFLSKSWHEYTGLSAEDAHGWGWQAAFHPEDLPPLMQAWQQLLISGESGEIEARLRRHDGDYRWFLIRVAPFRDDTGAIVRWYGTSTDIHDRKRAEDALRASENNLRQVVDGIPGLVATLSPSGEIELLNRRLLEYYGRTIEEMRDWATNDSIHPDDRSPSAAIIANSMKAGAPLVLELRCRRADGVYRWFQVSALPVRDTGGGISRWYFLQTDIEDRKRAEEELRRSEARKTAILDSALDCIVTIDHQGRITEFNPAAERNFGYRRDDVVGKRLADVIIPPSLRERHRQGFARYLATGEAQVLGRRIEMTAVRADGSEFPVELSISRIPVDGPPSFTGYLRDITERKEADEQLRRSEAFLAEGQRLSSTGSFSWCLDTDEVSFSEEACRIFEFERDKPVTLEQIGRRVHPDDIPFLSEKTTGARTTGDDQDYEIRLRMPNGRVKWLHTVSRAAPRSDGHLEYVGVIQDVTERRLTEEALNSLHSELAHVARFTSLGALTASIAHEVNQPLSGIVTNASTCLRMLAADPPNVDGARETARRTIRDGERANDVIKRLRALFTRKEITTESVDLNEATREVIALSQSDLQRNQVILRQELAESLPPVTGDRVQLQQVILNLLRNASDAMSGIEDRPRLLIVRTELTAENCVRLSVQDNGIGVDLPDLKRLFDAFYTTKSTGMGIGLSVCRSIIESHHGRLWAERNDGPGATFSFSLPGSPERAAGSRNPGSAETSVAADVV
jgi:PAS domain S-box-containing protein